MKSDTAVGIPSSSGTILIFTNCLKGKNTFARFTYKYVLQPSHFWFVGS